MNIRAQHCILIRGVGMDVFDASDHSLDWAGRFECGLLVDYLAAFSSFLIGNA